MLWAQQVFILQLGLSFFLRTLVVINANFLLMIFLGGIAFLASFLILPAMQSTVRIEFIINKNTL
jgi:hypothetical protein